MVSGYHPMSLDMMISKPKRVYFLIGIVHDFFDSICVMNNVGGAMPAPSLVGFPTEVHRIQ